MNRLLKMDKLALVELLSKLTEENDEATRRVEEMSKANADMVLAAHEMEERTRKATGQLAEAKAQLLSLQEEHLTMSENLAKAQNEVATLNQMLAATQSEGKVLRREFTGIQQSLTTAQNEVTALTQQLQQVEAERDALREAVESMPKNGKAKAMARVTRPVQQGEPVQAETISVSLDAQGEVQYLRRQLELKEEECALLRSKLLGAKTNDEGTVDFRLSQMTDVMLSAQELFRRVQDAADQCLERAKVLLIQRQEEADALLQRVEQEREALLSEAKEQAAEIVHQAEAKAQHANEQSQRIRRTLHQDMQQIAQWMRNMENSEEDDAHGKADSAE